MTPAYIAEGIREYRERLGMKRPEFGRKYGVLANTVYRWENGNDLTRTARVLAILADAAEDK